MNLGSLQEYRLHMLQVQAALSVSQRCHVAIPVSSLEKAVGEDPFIQTQTGRAVMVPSPTCYFRGRRLSDYTHVCPSPLALMKTSEGLFSQGP